MLQAMFTSVRIQLHSIRIPRLAVLLVVIGTLSAAPQLSVAHGSLPITSPTGSNCAIPVPSGGHSKVSFGKPDPKHSARLSEQSSSAISSQPRRLGRGGLEQR